MICIDNSKVLTYQPSTMNKYPAQSKSRDTRQKKKRLYLPRMECASDSGPPRYQKYRLVALDEYQRQMKERQERGLNMYGEDPQQATKAEQRIDEFNVEMYKKAKAQGMTDKDIAQCWRQLRY